MGLAKKTICPQCLGTGEFFNGIGIKKCKLCVDGVVTEEIEQSFIHEELEYE